MISTGFPRTLLLTRWLFATALSGVLVLSLLPMDHPDFSPNDKLNHLLAYGGLMVLGALSWRNLWWVAGGVFMWGVGIEGLQGLTPYRYFSLADMLANASGVLLGWMGYFGVRKLWVR
ncbi:hypothetical protein MED297_17068 [Reinekea sp. MED297]|uniref:VanZ-like domain-containing protein n=1 Tax=Reinekea blandensis MED297 TaxID=314283 RepID=A4BFH9_9GAMM|nr:hypothetical protein MED297_17068 [Reinekea sp. MED297] [Reinekea blandensis MED297]